LVSAPLTGRRAVVTGASRGIGLVIARALAGAGARVAMLARSGEVLAARASEIGAGALPVACDITDARAVERALAKVRESFGESPDILASNAGIFVPRPVEDLTPAELEEAVRVNLVAPFVLVHTLLPEMRARGRGHIVTIGSVADRTVLPENAAYSASKFGARALHEVMRLELRGSGVRTTLISPAATDTPIWDSVAQVGDDRFPPRSAMLPADAVAAAVLYALSQPERVNVDELRLSSA
jgi:NADP-dependent 3-hydroxy acid dehydrogenase YdfG